MCVEFLADIRRFILSLDECPKELITFRPLALRPVEIANLLQKLEKIYGDTDSIPESDVAMIGSDVSVLDMLDFREMNFQITLPQDSDPALGRITVLSPLGSKLIGRREGETINVFYGNRMNRFRLMSIKNDP